jgi:hypothetical protein
VLVLILLAAMAPGEPPPPVSRLMIRERLILRVPTRSATPRPRFRWKERRGPKCLAMAQIAGAAPPEDDQVDLILRNGGRVRAELSGSCPAIGFYGGFYVLPTPDRRICADRDVIHARSGGSCEIDRFRTLTAEPIEARRPK